MKAIHLFTIYRVRTFQATTLKLKSIRQIIEPSTLYIVLYLLSMYLLSVLEDYIILHSGCYVFPFPAVYPTTSVNL